MYLHYSESHLTWKIQTSIKFFLQLSEQMAHNRKLDVSGRNCRWHIRADATFYCLFMLCLDIVYNLFEYTDDICPLLNPAIQGWIQPIMLHQTNDDNNILHKNIIWTLLVLESKLWFCPFILLCLQKETEINSQLNYFFWLITTCPISTIWHCLFTMRSAMLQHPDSQSTKVKLCINSFHKDDRHERFNCFQMQYK